MHKSLNEFEILPEYHWFPWQHIGLQWEKWRHHDFSNVFDRIHFILAGYNDVHNALVICNHGPPPPGNSGDFDFSFFNPLL